MKNLLLFLSVWFSLSFNVCSTSKLSINLSYITKEKSKDSRLINEHFVLSNGVLKYTFADNRSGKGKKESETKLNSRQLKDLTKIITKYNLLRTVEIPEHADFEIPYTAVLLDCKIINGTKKGNINVYSLTENAESDQNYADVSVLKLALQKLIK